jgi:hypothetical protein
VVVLHGMQVPAGLHCENCLGPIAYVNDAPFGAAPKLDRQLC